MEKKRRENKENFEKEYIFQKKFVAFCLKGKNENTKIWSFIKEK